MKKSDYKRHKNYSKRTKAAMKAVLGEKKIKALIERGMK